jgi:DNA excision repair protein ERCC-4
VTISYEFEIPQNTENEEITIIEYNPSIYIWRKVEQFAIQAKKKINYYVLFYKNSIEQHMCWHRANKEKEYFNRLIEYKSKALVQCTSIPPAAESNSIVLVDMRELKSHLPSYLESEGMAVKVSMLKVGDYILSDKVCVERKSVTSGDLAGSLKSGRLYKQIKSMCHHYERPVVLLEFESV